MIFGEVILFDLRIPRRLHGLLRQDVYKRQIMEMSLRLAAAGHQVGLSEAQILGFAAALSSVGIEAEMGGSAFSKALVQMEAVSYTHLTASRARGQRSARTPPARDTGAPPARDPRTRMPERG